MNPLWNATINLISFIYFCYGVAVCSRCLDKTPLNDLPWSSMFPLPGVNAPSALSNWKSSSHKKIPPPTAYKHNLPSRRSLAHSVQLLSLYPLGHVSVGGVKIDPSRQASAMSRPLRGDGQIPGSGCFTFSLMNSQMILVISSPSISTTGWATLMRLSASAWIEIQLQNTSDQTTVGVATRDEREVPRLRKVRLRIQARCEGIWRRLIRLHKHVFWFTKESLHDYWLNIRSVGMKWWKYSTTVQSK